MAATAVDLPGYVAGSWRIDPARSHVSFAIRHLLVRNVRGRFTGVKGEVVTAADPLACHVTATIDLASIDTDNAQRDAHLRSARYLAVETHSRMTYRSTGLRQAGQGFLVHGELSVHGVTRPVVLALKLHEFIRDQHGQLRTGLSAVATIDRRILGINFGVPMDTAGVFIGRRVQVAIEVEASPALDRRSSRGDQQRHFVRPECR
jgi:polyisoprenoid-binding protein YceI